MLLWAVQATPAPGECGLGSPWLAGCPLGQHGKAEPPGGMLLAVGSSGAQGTQGMGPSPLLLGPLVASVLWLLSEHRDESFLLLPRRQTITAQKQRAASADALKGSHCWKGCFACARMKWLTTISLLQFLADFSFAEVLKEGENSGGVCLLLCSDCSLEAVAAPAATPQAPFPQTWVWVPSRVLGDTGNQAASFVHSVFTPTCEQFPSTCAHL